MRSTDRHSPSPAWPARRSAPPCIQSRMSIRWNVADIPDQTGRRAIITGANSGIGFPAALELARHGATVVVSSRDQTRGNAAVDRILRALTAGERIVLYGDYDVDGVTSLTILSDLLRSPTTRTGRRSLSALILCPTRELALQVVDHIRLVLRQALDEKNGPPRISVGTVVGGLSVQKQKRIVERGCDILVATPGRLWDLIKTVCVDRL